LHPLVAGFADAASYEKGRPQHGAEVVRVLAEQLDLTAGAPVLELGAGTGQLSRALLAGGLDIRAVEPLASMRQLLARAIGAERVQAGVAEEIPLPDRSVEAVLAADSFHWFDEARAMPEIRRVLRPGGGVAILRTVPMLEAPWSGELESILMRERPEHPAFAERGAAAALEEDGAFGPVREKVVSTEQSSDRERILAYLATVSWVGSLEADRRREVLAEVENLLERHGVIELHHRVRHQLWIASLTEAGRRGRAPSLRATRPTISGQLKQGRGGADARS
jgi:SAM-dependent methyltransferase